MTAVPGPALPKPFAVPLLFLWFAAPPAALAQAEGAAVAFGGLRGDPTLPVEVTADQLRVNQADATALFTGNVVVGQGLLRMTSAELLVEYDEAGQAISRMHATGGVTLVNGAETAEAQEAVYTIADGIVVMTGDVLLTQGTSAISGSRLNVDLNAGTGLMEGRVTTVFVPAASP
jgi:lipopolysaccharide export system protein LptA